MTNETVEETVYRFFETIKDKTPTEQMAIVVATNGFFCKKIELATGNTYRLVANTINALTVNSEDDFEVVDTSK